MPIFRDAKDPNKFYEVIKSPKGVQINFIEKKGEGYEVVRSSAWLTWRGGKGRAYAWERLEETPFDLLVDTEDGRAYESKQTVYVGDLGERAAPVGGVRQPIIVEEQIKVDQLYEPLKPISPREEAELRKKLK